MSTPIRTCVGCGERASQAALVRFVVCAGTLALDVDRRLGGRGAWLHRAPDCWTAFVRRRGRVRSLRTAPTTAAREALRDALAAGAC